MTTQKRKLGSEAIASLMTNEILDQYVRKNFERVKEFIDKESPLKGFRAYEISFTETKANYKFKHVLGFLPKDVLLSSQIGTGVIVFNYSSFTETEIDLTITGTVSTTVPTTIRFLLGILEMNR